MRYLIIIGLLIFISCQKKVEMDDSMEVEETVLL